LAQKIEGKQLGRMSSPNQSNPRSNQERRNKKVKTQRKLRHLEDQVAINLGNQTQRNVANWKNVYNKKKAKKEKPHEHKRQGCDTPAGIQRTTLIKKKGCQGTNKRKAHVSLKQNKQRAKICPWHQRCTTEGRDQKS